ncbi:MAG: TonB-dependent receptor [Terracidiphilus sp.]|nr:TonB-dependent receptor [Terracidiphilus sp.]
MNRIFRLVPQCMALLLLCWAASPFGNAQSTVDGAIDGHVSDSSGALMPNVQVTANDNGTNSTSTSVTDASGYYRVTRLKPGEYTLTLASQGFATHTVSHVLVQVGRVTTIDQTLAVSQNQQSVEVSANSNEINTESAEISTNLGAQSVSNLPINGRRWAGFVLLTPGAVLGTQFGLISFKGISALMNNNQIDGVDNMRAFESSERGYTRVGFSTSLAAIQEFQSVTSNYSAQYGRAAGGVINAITKSGSNQFHGSLFEYWRDNALGATNPYNILSTYDTATQTTTSRHIKPADKRHQLGGAIGGPLLRDKLFFFYAYDQQIRHAPAVGTPSSGAFFNITQSSQNICASGYSVNSCLLSRGETQTQIDKAVSFLEGLTGTEPREANEIVNFPKLDWKVNNRNNASVEYNRLRFDGPGDVQTNPVNAYAVHSFGNNYVKSDSIIAKNDTLLNATLNNEIRYEYSRDFDRSSVETPLSGEPLTGVNNLPVGVSITNGFAFGTPTNLPQAAYPDEREHQIVDNVIWSRGSHTFTFGGDWRHVQDHANYIGSVEGQYTFANMADWITQYLLATGASTVGCTATRSAVAGTLPCYQTFQQGFIQSSGFTFSTNDYSVFAQDDWKIRSNLSLNFGLRYEIEVLPDPQVPNANLAQTAIKPGDKNNIGPRIGFSWDPFRKGKTAVRGGYGLYYGRVINGAAYQVLSNSAANGAQYTVSLAAVNSGAQNPLAPTYPNTLSTSVTTSAARSVSVYSPALRIPMIQQADLSVQRDLGWGTTLTASYVLAVGHQLPGYVDINVAPSTATTTYTVSGGKYAGQSFALPLYSARKNSSFNAITQLTSNINSNYNAGTVQIEHRTGHNLQFQTSYTISKALDYGQNQTLYGDTNDQFDPFSLRQDYGISLVNCPQKLVGSAVWQPQMKAGSRILRTALNGWSVAPTWTYQSGLPYSYTVSGTNSTITTVPGATSSLNGSGGANYLPLAGRNSQRMKNTQNIDFRLSRTASLRGKANLELIAESFNLFNRTNVTGVNSTAYTVSGSTLVSNSAFGTTSSAGNTIYNSRLLQFAAKLNF